jgi:capsular polysaccharide biosynthesis protein
MYKIRDLIVPSYPRRTRDDFEWLREVILYSALDELNRSGNSTSKKLHVSPKNSVSRQVVNEDEPMNVLSEHGFERYLLENRSLVENARLFNRADIVVGPPRCRTH